MSICLTLLKRMPVTALIGLLLTFGFLVMALFAPWLAPYPMSESVGDMWMGPSAEFWLGTDNLGRDLLSRLIHGARTTMTIAALATALAFSIGSVLGILAAVYGGWVDQLISRGVDIVMSIPTLIFALVILSVMPSTVLMLIVIMGVLDSTRVFRISRAVAVNINVMDFVEAARLRGEGKGWIIFREILPNALTPLVAELGLRFIFAVLFLSSLSFLGLGVQPPEADWGSMVRENRQGIVFGVPAALIPAAAIALLAISVNLVADWVLRHTTDLKGGRRG
ncbi:MULTISPECIES: ABC transporter permease [Halomonadaceae]|jgi:peptide/nickel transport system permease protein|uniref:ABC transporter permease n=1 Tax=Vreelandella piezotolerans TaxID=2609667 RepID=A0ABQ6X8U5_9GAMM|nr:MULTISPECIES: ABC transporter permease [Halomonas]KAE8438422.1 ABC transporter permease [Halomonas piezotolerans]MCG7577519.1 ABC transporter permease [Halomonas sp. MMH1-48]MCG7592134.1 ABC transporter permease [Halomonas sp. McD50-5]MCG7604610.1 ABC transporter permease [Halomonas sp. MM17-34]MCG7613718.1 ABC transporter permease [Halomonas sp. MM17-29]